MNENGIFHPVTVVIINLPDERIFHRRNTLPPSSNIRLVYHGTISYRLGLDLAVQAVEKAITSVPVTFTIIGDGEQRESLLRYCGDKGLLNSVVSFKDFIPVEKLQEELEQYDIGIVANRRTLIGERCMLPVKMMEYLAIGLPVVVPRLPVIQYYFTDTISDFYYRSFRKQRVDSVHFLSRECQHFSPSSVAFCFTFSIWIKSFCGLFPGRTRRNMKPRPI